MNFLGVAQYFSVPLKNQESYFCQNAKNYLNPEILLLMLPKKLKNLEWL